VSDNQQPRSFKDRLKAIPERARHHMQTARHLVKTWKRPEWAHPRHFARIPKLAWIIPSAVLGTLLLGWVVLNFALADPRHATPAVNWALRTFGDKSASIKTAKLEKPFSSKFIMRGLDWPALATAKELDITLDYFGWLPSHPWAGLVRMHDGEITLKSSKANTQKTFNIQKTVNRIDAKNIIVNFTIRSKPKQITIISAAGSFAEGNVKAEATSGRSHLSFDGLARNGFGALTGNVTAKGENLADLAEIVGASAPDTPPFNVKGRLAMQDKTWAISDITGRMGDSDIGGLVSIDLKPDKPFLDVDLRSAKLDFDDLGVVFGIPVGADKGETTNEEQRKAKRAFDRSARLIPDARIDFSRLGAVNGNMAFTAARVIDAPAGITSLTFKGELRDRVLDFERVLVKTSTGDLDAKVRINAQKDPATTRVSGTLENVAITRVIPTTYIKGSFNGTFALTLTGSGFREAFGTATGEAGVWSNNSQLAKIATEAAGLDVGEVILILATQDKREYLKSTCLAANVAFANGMATLAPAVIDNADSLIVATGGVDLRTERLDIRIMSEPKDVSLGKLFGDIRIRGTLRHPDISALNAKTVIQAGLSALLAAIAGPLTALPFVEAGGGLDAPCATLIAESRGAGQAQDPSLRKRVPAANTGKTTDAGPSNKPTAKAGNRS